VLTSVKWGSRSSSTDSNRRRFRTPVPRILSPTSFSPNECVHIGAAPCDTLLLGRSTLNSSLNVEDTSWGWALAASCVCLWDRAKLLPPLQRAMLSLAHRPLSPVFPAIVRKHFGNSICILTFCCTRRVSRRKPCYFESEGQSLLALLTLFRDSVYDTGYSLADTLVEGLGQREICRSGHTWQSS